MKSICSEYVSNCGASFVSMFPFRIFYSDVENRSSLMQMFDNVVLLNRLPCSESRDSSLYVRGSSASVARLSAGCFRIGLPCFRSDWMSLTNFSVFDLKLLVMSLMWRDATSADVSDFSCYGAGKRAILPANCFFLRASEGGCETTEKLMNEKCRWAWRLKWRTIEE